MIARRKNAAAYQVKRSAVKKIQKEKRGIDNKRHKIPENAITFGLRFTINNAKMIRKAISCIFIIYCL